MFEPATAHPLLCISSLYSRIVTKFSVAAGVPTVSYDILRRYASQSWTTQPRLESNLKFRGKQLPKPVPRRLSPYQTSTRGFWIFSTGRMGGR